MATKKTTLIEMLRIERDYYREEIEELREIVLQLFNPKAKRSVTYIHPFDIAEMFNDKRKKVPIVNRDAKTNILTISGIRYKMSCSMPARTKSIV